MAFHWEISTFDALSNNSLYQAMRLRQAVFVVEQNCIYPDLDGLDQESTHVLCWRDEELLAYQRCLPPGLSYSESSLGRIVVSPAGRGHKLGRELVQRGIDINMKQWPQSNIKIGAQAYLRSFYQSLGFVVLGDEYIEDGIAHIHMLRHTVTVQEET
ncbi:MAG: GNAT family N-acetyltransferase [Halioglobus sp.]